jgi:hypothetical protein
LRQPKARTRYKRRAEPLPLAQPWRLRREAHKHARTDSLDVDLGTAILRRFGNSTFIQ